ncbi:hypothetical protein C4571_00340 [Candidatus Parcubacteria bacterium]|nr:MAG: hypothetical protein C4571_00340 [Candidatus Parcubacteria bacterium]
MNIDVRNLTQKLFLFLRVRSPIGALELADVALRFSYFDGKLWQLKSVRLPPGTIEGGKIKNRGQLLEALKTLRKQIPDPIPKRGRAGVILVASSLNLYSQVFSLPFIEGEGFDKAVELNMQMVSPIEVGRAYSGWQVVGEEDEGLRIQVLGAFVESAAIDEVNKALFEAGFLGIVAEPRALALARLLREAALGFDSKRPALLLHLDSSGLTFLIVRGGQLYFEYSNLWRDVADEKQQITFPVFEAAITRSLHQVTTFYSQHWQDQLEEIFLSANNLIPQITKIINENFPLKVKEIKLGSSQAITPEWFVAVGAGLRGLKPRWEDKEISLLGLSAEEEFQNEQLAHFLRFWRVAVPSVLALFLAVFFGADLVLTKAQEDLEAKLLLQKGGSEMEVIGAFETQAKEFNRSVALIRSAESSIKHKTPLLEVLTGLVAENGVLLRRISFDDINNQMVLLGVAGSEDNIKAFKKALETNAMFQGIDLPFTEIKKEGGGFSFSVSFGVTL